MIIVNILVVSLEDLETLSELELANISHYFDGNNLSLN